ncbi:MAG: hypothetical protein QRY74_04780 [Chlamydia sp.]
MKNIAENNLVRFINVTKKKQGLFANFRMKGIRGGVSFSASVAVDISACEVDPAGDSLEKIIEECAKIAVREMKRIDVEFEGLQSV